MANQIPLTRQALERAVRDYKREKASYFLPAGELKPKQITNAVRRIAPKVKEKDVVALMDTTLLNSGKDGYLITLTHMYGKSFEGKTIDLNQVCKVSHADSYLTVTYPDGKEEKLYCIIYEKDLFEFLKLVMQESEELNRQPDPPKAPEFKAPSEIRDLTPGALISSGLRDAQEETPAEEVVPTPVVYETMDEPEEEEISPIQPAENGDAEELFRQGTAAFMKKDYTAAKDAFRKAAELGHQKAAQFLAQLDAFPG